MMITSRFFAFVIIVSFGMPLCGMESLDNLTGWVYARLSSAPELKDNQRIEYRYFNPEQNAKLGTTEYVQAGSVPLNGHNFTMQLPIVPGKQNKVPVAFALASEDIKYIKSARMFSTYHITKDHIPAADRQELIWDIKEGCIKVGFVLTYKRNTTTPCNVSPKPGAAQFSKKPQKKQTSLSEHNKSIIE